MKKIVLITFLALLVLSVLALVTTAASAASCNSGHGAFGAFRDPSLHFTPGQPPYFGDDLLGSARGGLTGENNSNYSHYCNGN